MVLSVLDVLIFSPRLRALFSSLGATNIQYAPVKLVDPVSGVTTTDYHLANVLGLVDCIDLENAYVERSAKTGRIMSLEAFQLHLDRVSPLPGMPAAPVIFRLRDSCLRAFRPLAAHAHAPQPVAALGPADPGA